MLYFRIMGESNVLQPQLTLFLNFRLEKLQEALRGNFKEQCCQSYQNSHMIVSLRFNHGLAWRQCELLCGVGSFCCKIIELWICKLLIQKNSASIFLLQEWMMNKLTMKPNIVFTTESDKTKNIRLQTKDLASQPKSKCCNALLCSCAILEILHGNLHCECLDLWWKNSCLNLLLLHMNTNEVAKHV